MIGILLANIGTPDEPTPAAVRRYLKEFLSDPRIVQLPRFIWQPILHSVILPFRPAKSAALYQKIWTENGSPLLVNTRELAKLLEDELKIPVVIGMRYGQPSIESALDTLRAKGVDDIIIFPLYPQYSTTTTASTTDKIAAIPKIKIIPSYAREPSYIDALTSSIQQHWKQHGKTHLMFSFHGIPKRYVDQGDPYAEQCHATTKLVTTALQLEPSEWTIAFQSRLGRTTWLMPYTDQVLQSLPKKGIEHVQVICPGFAVDCLETLEEIAIRGKEQFLEAGGKSFSYIEALNSTPLHIQMLAKIFLKTLF